MKAIIQFEIQDKNKSDDELKEQLLNDIVEIMDDWLKGDTVLMIDFIKTYDNSKNNKTSDFFNFNPDETIH